jgi:hypothetical protein
VLSTRIGRRHMKSSVNRDYARSKLRQSLAPSNFMFVLVPKHVPL